MLLGLKSLTKLVSQHSYMGLFKSYHTNTIYMLVLVALIKTIADNIKRDNILYFNMSTIALDKKEYLMIIEG